MTTRRLHLLAFVVLAGCSAFGQKQRVAASVDPEPIRSSALAFQSGQTFGATLSAADRASLASAESRALDFGNPGEELRWKGGAADVSGVVVAYQPFRVGQTNCRRFAHKLKNTGGSENIDGTACRNTNGAWRLVR